MLCAEEPSFIRFEKTAFSGKMASETYLSHDSYRIAIVKQKLEAIDFC